MDDEERIEMLNKEERFNHFNQPGKLKETPALKVEFSSSISSIAGKYTTMLAWFTPPTLMHSHLSMIFALIIFGPYHLTYFFSTQLVRPY